MSGMDEYIQAIIREALATRQKITVSYVRNVYSYFKIDLPELEDVFIEYENAPIVYSELFRLMLLKTDHTCRPLRSPSMCEFEITRKDWLG